MQKRLRINSLIEVVNFIVEVRCRAQSGVAAFGNDITLPDDITHLDVKTIKMAVHGGKAILVLNLDHLAYAIAVATRPDNNTVGGGNDRSAHVSAQIHAMMHASAALQRVLAHTIAAGDGIERYRREARNVAQHELLFKHFIVGIADPQLQWRLFIGIHRQQAFQVHDVGFQIGQPAAALSIVAIRSPRSASRN